MLLPTKRKQTCNPGFHESDYLKTLFAAGARASALGMGVLDSQTRFEYVNASLARETRAAPDDHIGRTSREVVGDIAGQIEPTYEKVLRTGKPASVLLTGHVRNTPEFGYWLDHCFPICDSAGRVQQLGLFVVNITAERAALDLFDALAADPKRIMAEAAGLLAMFDESIRRYHLALTKSFEELASPFSDPPRKVDDFRSAIRAMDSDIDAMREIIYAVVSQFSIPAC